MSGYAREQIPHIAALQIAVVFHVPMVCVKFADEAGRGSAVPIGIFLQYSEV
jgi:hypothetical protein